MFFTLSKNPKKNFIHTFELGRVFLNTDAGWKVLDLGENTVYYKGYADSAPLESLFDAVIEQERPTLKGNFCMIIYNHSTKVISIKTDLYRSFPIYLDPGREITNLYPTDDVVWTDSAITADQELNIEKIKHDVIGKINTDPIDKETALNQIDELLSKKTQQFLQHNKLPIKVHLSGGVDSMLVFSYLKKYTDNFELIKCSHIDYDRFWLCNEHQLKKFWGYKQIHHWTAPCVLTSGAPGDEFMLRSPLTSHYWLTYHDQNLITLLNQPQWKNCLHRDYFKKPELQEIFQRSGLGNKTYNVYWQLCNININDWQHWHLGNTLTWTPLRDIEIFKILIRLPLEDAVGQIFDSELSKTLIKHNDPALVDLISTQKNSGSYMSNLADFLCS